MNYGELKTAVLEYMHRDDLQPQIELFVQLAHSRIMRDIRSRGMIEDETLTMTTNPQPLPEGLLDLRELGSVNGNPRYTLRSVGRSQIERYSNGSGRPQVYSMIGKNVEIAPYSEGIELRIIYYKAFPFFTNDEDTNSILEQFPDLYLYGTLIEANKFIQDAEQRMVAIEFYQTERETVNMEETSSRYGEAPQIGAA